MTVMLSPATLLRIHSVEASLFMQLILSRYLNTEHQTLQYRNTVKRKTFLKTSNIVLQAKIRMNKPGESLKVGISPNVECIIMIGSFNFIEVFWLIRFSK